MTGVALDQLHCPTCGDSIVDFNLHSDPEEFEVAQTIRPISAVARTRLVSSLPQPAQVDGHDDLAHCQ